MGVIEPSVYRLEKNANNTILCKYESDEIKVAL